MNKKTLTLFLPHIMFSSGHSAGKSE